MFNVRRLLNPQWLLKSLAVQFGGVIVHAATQKYVPNKWGQWAVGAGACLMGMYYPITRLILTQTGLDDMVENI